MLRRDELNRYLDDLLETARFDDYAPNGLQVEGAQHISTLVTGVTASRALVDAALQAGAEALLVHHGYFWRGEDPRIVGMKRARLAPLLAHDINLFAYHLPLDAPADYGNNVHAARELGIHLFAAGHHATERYGVAALGDHLAQHFGITHVHIEIPNPV